MGFFDNLIRAFSPEAALKRKAAEHALNELEQIRNYDAAKRGRRTKNWYTVDSGPNQATVSSLSTLRARSRDLVRNNPWARKAIEVLKTNVVGTGIRPNFDTQNKRFVQSWKEWAETTECDFDGRLDFYGLQGLVMRNVADAGECLVRKRVDANGKYPIKLQVLEADFLDINKDGTITENGNLIVGGVEFDDNGRRVAYWLYTSHPSENRWANFDVISKRIPADEVLHVFRQERPGQVRGVPFGASALLRLRDLDEYEDAQLVRQKIAACFSAFVTSTGEASFSSNNNPQYERLEPGTIQYLERGEGISFAAPPGAEGYGEYTKKVLQSIAAGFGITYEAMTGDLTNVNFSSGRMGWLEFQRNVQDLQFAMMIPQMCIPAFAWFMDSAKLGGQIAGTMRSPGIDWTPARREMIDPLKETQAIKEAIMIGIQPWQEAVREQGYSPEAVLEMLKQDQDNFDKYELKLTSDPRNASSLQGQQSQSSGGGE